MNECMGESHKNKHRMRFKINMLPISKTNKIFAFWHCFTDNTHTHFPTNVIVIINIMHQEREKKKSDL